MAGPADAERLRRLQSLTDAALAHLELDDLLNTLLLRTRDELQVDTVATLLLDRDANELVAVAAVGIEEEVEAGIRIPVGQGFAGRVAATRKPVVLNDVDHADVMNPILHEKGIKSLLGVPLVVGRELVGVLHVGSLVEREFSPEEVELLQFAADRAAIAIEHARLYEAERRARARVENVQLITDVALAHLELEELLSVLLPRIRDILHADTCAVLLLDEEEEELVARAAVGIEEEVEAGVRIPLGKGFAGRVAATKHPVVIEDLDEYDVWNPILREKGIRSMLGVPLLVRGAAIGVLHVGTLTQRRFAAEDAELLSLVADRVAIAIERARLHEETVQLDQLKLNFVAIASHELRTPATSVYGALATLVERRDLPEHIREKLLLVAYEQADRLRRLLEQLLDLSRLDAAAINVEPRPLVVRALLEEIVRGVAPPEWRIRMDVASDLAAVVDPLVVDRVVSNLLANAMRHGEPPIVLAAEQRDRHMRIAVEDEGPGVPDDLQIRLFERFSRGSEHTGSGLGLAIARAYAVAHGGELVYEQREHGARFELIVPQG